MAVALNDHASRKGFHYHAGTVAASTHAVERIVQRCKGLTADQVEQVTQRAVQVAGDERNLSHTAARVLVLPDGRSVWVYVRGLTCLTVMVLSHHPEADPRTKAGRYVILN